MLANLIAQINRLRDEILPALTSALAVIATLRADNATLTAERDAAVARVTELENGIPQAATDLTAINDQLAALAA